MAPYTMAKSGLRMERMMRDLGKRTLVMGILNITPDSFSDGGRFLDVDAAVAHAVQMVQMGADLIDIGAESTRPHATVLSFDEEWSRLEPVLALIRDAVDIPLSIDTYKAKVARMAMEVGLDIVNDVWGGLKDSEMMKTVSEYSAPYVIMHNACERASIATDIATVVRDDLMLQARRAMAVGVLKENIIIDPGIGFGKTMQQNLELINRLEVLKETGYPVLVGTSRKSVIGHILGLPIEERIEGTSATVTVAIVRGADIIRVHDVKEMARVAKMTDSLVRIP